MIDAITTDIAPAPPPPSAATLKVDAFLPIFLQRLERVRARYREAQLTHTKTEAQLHAMMREIQTFERLLLGVGAPGTTAN